MTPEQLTIASFAAYPPQARHFAAAHLPLLRELPIAVAPAFLGQVIVYDWRFPAERVTLERQCAWLESLTSDQRASLLAPFRRIVLTDPVVSIDWVNAPQRFIEALTGYLWSSGQIDAYRRAAQHLLAVPPERNASSPNRRVAVIVGRDAKGSYPRLFRKLAPHGVTLENLRWTAETPTQLHALFRPQLAGEPVDAKPDYAHWYIDGGEPWPQDAAGLHQVSYAKLRPVRDNVLARMSRFIQSGPGGPEEMRSALARLTPVESGADAVSEDPCLQHFVTTLFTEGSGTQIYSTSFVQWAARETLRRAQPTHLLVRFAPRQRQRTLNQLFDTAVNVEVADPEGSLLDAEIGAYYTWIEAAKLADPQHLTFLAWREGSGRAVLIAPRVAAGTVDASSLDLNAAIAKYA